MYKLSRPPSAAFPALSFSVGPLPPVPAVWTLGVSCRTPSRVVRSLRHCPYLWPETPRELVSARIDFSSVLSKYRIKDASPQITSKVNKRNELSLPIFFDWKLGECGPRCCSGFFENGATPKCKLAPRPTENYICQRTQWELCVYQCQLDFDFSFHR